MYLFSQALAAPPELRTQGNQVVVAATGTPVRLAGVNIASLEWGTGENLQNSLQVAVSEWRVNVVRLPVEVSRWLAGGTYIATVDSFINLAAAANVYVILDLHEYGQPNANCTAFWTDAATRYRNNPAVIFGLLNEPHDITWDVWRNGDASHPGMQDLLDTVRATGARNIVLAGGGDWGYDLSGIVAGYALTDLSGNGVIYDSHVYPWKSGIQSKVGTVAQVYPVLLGEMGHPGGTTFLGKTFEDSSTWTPRIMDWINCHNLHWTGWSFHPTARPCLISDWSYTPTPYWGNTALQNLQSYQNASADRVVGGTVIGTSGTRTQPGSGTLTDFVSGAVVAFDDGHTRYFDASTASGGWTGLDLGSPKRITRVDFMPRSGAGNLMVGGVFQGANNAAFSSGVVTLHTVGTPPVASGSVYTRATIGNSSQFRYVRYLGPTGAFCNVASILFYTGDGTGSGSAGTDVIVDNNASSGVVKTGVWVVSSSGSGFVGSNYFHDDNVLKGTKSVRFTPNLAVTGNYEVFGRWTSNSNRATNVPIDINHAQGADFVQVNQQASGSQWVSLGVYPFNAGTVGNILLSNSGTAGYVVADAVRVVRSALVEIDNADTSGVAITGSWTATTTAGCFRTNAIHDGNTGQGTKSVRFTPNILQAGSYRVYLWWSAYPNRATNTPVDINHAGGTSTVLMNQTINGGMWVLIGTYAFNAGAAGNVLIRTTGANGHVIADAVRFVPNF